MSVCGTNVNERSWRLLQQQVENIAEAGKLLLRSGFPIPCLSLLPPLDTLSLATAPVAALNAEA